MAFLIPVMKKEYEILSTSPGKHGKTGHLNSGFLDKKPKSNSVALPVHEPKSILVKMRPHSRSLNMDSHRNSTGGRSVSSADNIDVIKQMMTFDYAKKNGHKEPVAITKELNEDQLKNKDKGKIVSMDKRGKRSNWSLKIFGHAKGSQLSQRTIN